MSGYINEPDMSYMKSADIERLKSLTRLDDFALDLHDPLLQVQGGLGSSEPLCNVTVSEAVEPVNLLHCDQVEFPHTEMALHSDEPLFPIAVEQMCNVDSTKTAVAGTSSSANEFEERIIYLPSFPSKEQWNNIVSATNGGVSLTGSAANGRVGPILGLIDIGECDDSYLFRVSLPGVKRDDREFSCEVDYDGKVMIKGVTETEEGTVHRYTQVFTMQSQNLCPSGIFSISFKLPGPVNPQQFSGVFGTDGIFEGLVMKEGSYIVTEA